MSQTVAPYCGTTKLYFVLRSAFVKLKTFTSFMTIFLVGISRWPFGCTEIVSTAFIPEITFPKTV